MGKTQNKDVFYSFLINRTIQVKKVRGKTGAMPSKTKHTFSFFAHTFTDFIYSSLEQVIGTGKRILYFIDSHKHCEKAKEFIWQICLKISLMFRTPATNSSLLI